MKIIFQKKKIGQQAHWQPLVRLAKVSLARGSTQYLGRTKKEPGRHRKRISKANQPRSQHIRPELAGGGRHPRGGTRPLWTTKHTKVRHGTACQDGQSVNGKHQDTTGEYRPINRHRLSNAGPTQAAP